MKIAAIIFGIIIVVLLGVLIFVRPAKSPTVTQVTSSSTTAGGGVGLVEGKVVLGPTCPIESIPPNSQCAPKPYQASVAISYNTATQQPLQVISSDASGTFSVSLAPGNYLFYVQKTSLYPRCGWQSATVIAGQTSSITISCDSGIR